MADKIWVGNDAGNEGDINVAANWNPSGVPVASDNLWFDSTSTQAVTGSLSSLSAVLLGNVVIDGATYAIGTSTDYLELQTANANVRSHTQAGYLDFGATTAVEVVVDSASNLSVLAANASSDIIINGGSVNVAVPRDETATIGSISKRSGTLIVGEGVTLTTVNSDAGSTELRSGCTTINILKGSVTTVGEGAYTTINIDDTGTLFPNSSGTVTTVNIDGGGKVDTTKSLESRTFTTINLDGNGELKYDESYITITTLAIGTFTKPRTLRVI